MAQNHHLKTWPEFFEAIFTAEKTFEVRKDDREFQVGDTLTLNEWDPKSREYTGRWVEVDITYKLTGGNFGIEKDYCVLGIRFYS